MNLEGENLKVTLDAYEYYKELLDGKILRSFEMKEEEYQLCLQKRAKTLDLIDACKAKIDQEKVANA
ncbi:MAG: hypothetical protein WCL51_17475 [Bacteroidota bacterium]